MTADPVTRRATSGIPDATVARLPEYLRALSDAADRGVARVSSEDLATATRLRPTQVRKDLSQLGSYGVRGVGYDVDRLAGEIATVLGLSEVRSIAIVGMGNLGRALAAYHGLHTSGFKVAALLDADPSLTGEVVAGLVIRPMSDLDSVVSERTVSIAVIATPGSAAQRVCDEVVAAGIRSVLTFAPATLQVPAGVLVRRVDIATELHVLAFHEAHRALAGGVR